MLKLKLRVKDIFFSVLCAFYTQLCQFQENDVRLGRKMVTREFENVANAAMCNAGEV